MNVNLQYKCQNQTSYTYNSAETQDNSYFLLPDSEKNSSTYIPDENNYEIQERFSCSPNGMNDNTPPYIPESSLLAGLFKLVHKSITGRKMLENAKYHGWNFILDDMGESEFHMDIPQKTIILNNFSMNERSIEKNIYFRMKLLTAFIKSLRDIWHESRQNNFEYKLTPESFIVSERIRSADIDVTCIKTAWELRNKGYKTLWRHLLGSQDGYLATVFFDFLERRPYLESDNKVLAHIFTLWFEARENINATDAQSLEYLDNLLEEEEEHGYGINTHSKELTAGNVIDLTTLADKTCYLENEHLEDIFTNPQFHEIEDPINRAYLLQISSDIEAKRKNTTIAGGLEFHDAKLARMIFPD